MNEDAAERPRRPLTGVRVACLAHQYPGPYATMVLSDLGADVVLVEHPDGGDPARSFPGFHGSMARGKRSVTLDLKSAAGRTALEALLEHSDVLMDGFRPGTLGRLGFGEQELRRRYPALIYVTITGFGWHNGLADRPGHDLVFQAESGLLASELVGPEPSLPAIELADVVSGLVAVQAVLVGLLERRTTASGSVFDVSMFDSLVSLLPAYLVPVANDLGPATVPKEPGYGVFRTSDERFVALGVALEDHFWRALCDALGLPEERDLPVRERFAEEARLRTAISRRIQTRTAAAWEQVLHAANVPFGLVRDLREVPELPITSDRALMPEVVEADGTKRRYVRQPLIINGQTLGPLAGVPALGEHTREVLSECGVDDATIDAVVRRQ